MRVEYVLVDAEAHKKQEDAKNSIQPEEETGHNIRLN